MKFILCITLGILCLGCHGLQCSNEGLDSVAAKAALLDLMRKAPSPFEGADPARFETIELVEEGQGKFGWGAFVIDLGKKTYSANVDADTAFWSYQGRFFVDPSGKWRAENLSKQHGRK